MNSLRGTALNIASSFAPPFFALASAPILARGLGVDGRGEVAAGLSLLTLAISALTLGVPEALTYVAARHRVVDGPSFRVGFGALLLAGIGVAVTVALTAPLLSGSEDVAPLLRMAGGVVPFALVAVGLRGLAAGLGMWARISAERVAMSLCRLVLLAGLLASGWLTPMTATFVLTVSYAVGAVFYVGPLRKSRGCHIPRSAQPGRVLLGFGIRYWPGSLAGALLQRLDQFLMVPLSDSRQLGLYAVAVTLAEAALVFNTALREVLYAVESGSPSNARTGRAARISTVVTVATSIFIAIVGAPVIRVLFGSDFMGSVQPLLILLLGVCLGNPGSICGAALGAAGRPELRSFSLMVAASINAVAVFVLVPRFGASGAAWATLVGNIVAAGFNMFWGRRILGLRVRELTVPTRADWHYLKAGLLGLLNRGSSSGS